MPAVLSQEDCFPFLCLPDKDLRRSKPLKHQLCAFLDRSHAYHFLSRSPYLCSLRVTGKAQPCYSHTDNPSSFKLQGFMVSHDPPKPDIMITSLAGSLPNCLRPLSENHLPDSRGRLPPSPPPSITASASASRSASAKLLVPWSVYGATVATGPVMSRSRSPSPQLDSHPNSCYELQREPSPLLPPPTG